MCVPACLCVCMCVAASFSLASATLFIADHENVWASPSIAQCAITCLYHKAQLHFRRGQYEDAASLFKEVLNRMVGTPTSPGVAVATAVVSRWAGDRVVVQRTHGGDLGSCLMHLGRTHQVQPSPLCSEKPGKSDAC